MKLKDAIKVFIVDDHAIVRRGLAEYIETQNGITVCGEADNASAAIAAINKTMPDIAIVDISLKGTNGIDLTRAIVKRYKKVKVLILSMHEENEYVSLAIDAGAKGYVAKSETEDQIINAIYQVISGKTFLSNCLKDNVLENMLWKGPSNEISLNKLTNRELEIFNLIGEGANTKQIAQNLSLSASTVGTYRERIKSKLNIESSSELVKFAIQNSLKSIKGSSKNIF